METTADSIFKSNTNNLLDELYLHLLNLIEQHIKCKGNVERLVNAGQLLLAKTRYVQGTQTVSALQLPTENSANFKALCQVRNKSDEDTLYGSKIQLVRFDVEKKNGYVEPLHWFNVLAPNTLRNAAAQYRKSLELIIECANIQREIAAVMDSIKRLKE